MILFTILHLRRIRFREVQEFTQGYTAKIQAHYLHKLFSPKRERGKKKAWLMTRFGVREISK